MITFFITLAILSVVGAIVWLDLRNTNKDETVTGPGHEIAQVLDEEKNVKKIDEPTFSMELPTDWKEVARVSDSQERSVTWQATKKNEDNRYMTVYVDAIPRTKAVTRMLPLLARGDSFVVGEASASCSSFTKYGDGTGRQDQDAPAKYQNHNFICDLGRAAVDNEIGTGSTDGVNLIYMTGPSKGKHGYFFVFTDHNIQANTNIFYNALKSFRAK